MLYAIRQGFDSSGFPLSLELEALQSVFTYGAADVAFFHVDSTPYLLFLNYFDGFSFNHSSTLYALSFQAAPRLETAVPELTPVQFFSTLGARCAKHLTAFGQDWLLIAEEIANVTTLHRWSSSAGEFERVAAFPHPSPSVLEVFAVDSAVLVAVGSLSTHTVIVQLLDALPSPALNLVSTLPTGPADAIHAYTSLGSTLIAVALRPQAAAFGAGSTEVYTFFRASNLWSLQLRLPTTSASALLHLASANQPEGGGLLVAGNGWGSGIEGFGLAGASLEREASRMAAVAVPADPVCQLFAAFKLGYRVSSSRSLTP